MHTSLLKAKCSPQFEKFQFLKNSIILVCTIFHISSQPTLWLKENVHFKFWLKFAKFLEISSQCERANLPSELQNLSRFTLEIRSKCERTNLLVFINVGAMRLWKI